MTAAKRLVRARKCALARMNCAECSFGCNGYDCATRRSHKRPFCRRSYATNLDVAFADNLQRFGLHFKRLLAARTDDELAAGDDRTTDVEPASKHTHTHTQATRPKSRKKTFKASDIEIEQRKESVCVRATKLVGRRGRRHNQLQVGDARAVVDADKCPLLLSSTLDPNDARCFVERRPKNTSGVDRPESHDTTARLGCRRLTRRRAAPTQSKAAWQTSLF